MKDFVLLYRMDNSLAKPTPEQAQEMTKKWMDWIGHINATGNLIDRGNRLDPETGRILRPNNVITNGPFAEIKETIGGFSIIKAESYDDALAIAKGCPGLTVGGCVEIREVSKLS